MTNFDDPRIKEAIGNAKIDEKYKEIIKMRYGIGYDKPWSVSDIGKKFKLRGTKLKEEMEKAERLAFNILKIEDLYDIIIQN
ncbi:MAG: hypothetical protein JW702_00595 [Clostridiales bacterium]|nr:hypothetical protein [Clostridiales bacterium]